MMLNNSLQKLRNRLSSPIGHALITKRLDDVYIAAFPRSGSTWLRTVLVNIIDPSAKSNPDVFNRTIPAVSIRNARQINALASPRKIMTHGVWRPSIKKAVYLVRDGRDAFISSYHYHVTRNKLEMSIEQYFDLYQAQVYGHTWSAHVSNWLVRAPANLQENLLLVKFEDLKENTEEILSSVCRFMHLEASDLVLSRAIEMASIENARKIEQARQGVIENSNASFYRTGESQQWQRSEYADVIQKFNVDSGKAFELAGYR